MPNLRRAKVAKRGELAIKNIRKKGRQNKRLSRIASHPITVGYDDLNRHFSNLAFQPGNNVQIHEGTTLCGPSLQGLLLFMEQ